MADATIIRSPKDRTNPYAQIRRETLEDERLSWAARGLLAYLLSKPDHWKIRASDLMKRGNLKRDGIYGLLKELEQAGYLTRERTNNARGHLQWEMHIHETPVTDLPEVVAPYTAQPYTAQPYTVKPDLSNKGEYQRRSLVKREAAPLAHAPQPEEHEQDEWNIDGLKASEQPDATRSEPTAEDIPPRAPRQPDPLFEALAAVCGIDWRSPLMTSKQRGQLNQACQKLRKVDATPDEVLAFGAWWQTHDWRGRKGEAPDPARVLELWQKAQGEPSGPQQTLDARYLGTLPLDLMQAAGGVLAGQWSRKWEATPPNDRPTLERNWQQELAQRPAPRRRAA